MTDHFLVNSILHYQLQLHCIIWKHSIKYRVCCWWL